MDILLFNENAGAAKRLGLTAEDILSRLSERGVRAELPVCGTEEEMLEAAANATGRVIVAGGDGTIQPILQAGNRCESLDLAIIPVGTANHLAAALGIPSDIDGALDVIARGHSKRIDLGKVNGTVFSQAAGVGFHASVFHAYGEHKEKSAVDAATAVAGTLTDWSPRLVRVVLDGEPYLGEVTQVTVANTPMYGARFMIAPEARLDDGLLDVVVMGKLTKIEIVRYAVAAMTGEHVNLPKTYMARAKRVDIDSVESEPIEVHADAAPVGCTPKTIEVLPSSLSVVVPEEAR